MPYDGSGNFTRSYNFTADKLAAIKIQSVRVDGEFDNYATAMNQVLLRSGVAPLTGNLKLGGNSVTGVASGSAPSPAINFTTDVTTGIFLPSAGVLGFSAGGVEKGRFTSTGFSVTGALAVSGAAATGALTVTGDITNTGKAAIGQATARTTLDVAGITSIRGGFEDVAYSTTALTGTIQLDYKTQAVWIYDTNAAGNFTFNIRGDSGTSLDSIMAVGQVLTLAVEVPQGGTAFYCTTITVDGAAVSQLKWFGGAPTAGNVSGIDVYAITVYKKAANTFYVRASQSQVK